VGAIVPLITAALPYIIPAATTGIGWVIGWFHHKHSAAKAANPKK
jgi:hypothetical protein